MLGPGPIYCPGLGSWGLNGSTPLLRYDDLGYSNGGRLQTNNDNNNNNNSNNNVQWLYMPY